ncbi:transmembrane 4 L6 family member 1-like [Seriola lalandi dorsalis]|uniref:transmembrane 4 L6 family member 1-like n=2 Tax=Seriola TaxID=8160 RepID=UPI000C6FB600|nr:transmembrane 4 L6 family member 1-like [Seriola lalandi dorsalis]
MTLPPRGPTQSCVVSLKTCVPQTESELDHQRVQQQLFMMCVSRCLLCVGMSLVPMAIVCMVSNILLLIPELNIHFLLEGHVTREATWATGLWGSGFLVLLGARVFVQSSRTRGCCAFRSQMLSHVAYSCVCLLAAGSCCLVSATGLVQGPLCLYNTTTGTTWGVPLKPLADSHSGYLYNRTLWSGVCLQPRAVVEWNVVLFSVMGGTSALQTFLCAANILNSLLGLIVGQGFCHNKVSPV